MNIDYQTSISTYLIIKLFACTTLIIYSHFWILLISIYNANTDTIVTKMFGNLINCSSTTASLVTHL